MVNVTYVPPVKLAWQKGFYSMNVFYLLRLTVTAINALNVTELYTRHTPIADQDTTCRHDTFPLSLTLIARSSYPLSPVSC